MIPFLTRIDNELAQCHDPLLQAELQAERASYLARTGDFAEANRILTALRQGYGDGRYVRISVWIMFLEGLIRFFETIDQTSRDRILRAHAVSVAAGLKDLDALTAVWLAHIEFNRSDFESALVYLRKCLDRRPVQPESARLRATLVLADLHMHAGELRLARSWYERTRLDAVALGDEATLAAMIFNKAALGLSRLRLAATSGEVEEDLIQFVSLEIASARNFHAGTENFTLSQLIVACEARILLLQGQYSRATHLLRSLLENEDLSFGFKSDRLLLQLEYIQCLAMTGAETEAIQLLASIEFRAHAGMTTDDRLIFLSTASALFGRLGVGAEGSVDIEQMAQCRTEYQHEIDLLRQSLADLGASPLTI